MNRQEKIMTMPGFSGWMVFFLLWLLFCAEARAISVVEMKLVEQADQSEVVMEFSQPLLARPGLFRISNPARQVLDFPAVLSGNLPALEVPSNSRIRKAQWVSAGGKSRLVFEMANNYEVKLSQQDSSLRLAFSGPAPFVPDGGQAAVLPPQSALNDTVAQVLGKPPVQSEGPLLKNWQITQVAGQSVIRLEFDRADIRADALLKDDLLKVRFANGRLAPGVPDRISTAPGLPASMVMLKPGDQVLTLQMQLDKATHQVRQQGPLLEIQLIPLQAAGSEVKTVALTPSTTGQNLMARYSGRPITLDFKDADIRTVMQVFADFTRMNLVLSDAVQGKVTVFLKDVPWDQALDIVMRSRGLVASQSGNVLLVSTPTDVNNDQFQAANRRAQDNMEPVLSRVFQISYQKTADLVALIKAQDSQLLSSRGTLISDERTSQIFVQDTPSRLERISMIINGLDKPVKQVMIEARVVLADTSVSRDLGVRVRSASALSEDFTEIGEQFGRKGYVDSSPLSGTNLAYTLFNANSTRLINLQLRALETDNKIRTVSNPRVITSNKEPALIEQGTEIPYQIATSSGATATEFKEANLKLAVTPQIAPDGTVLLDVDVAKDSLGINTANGPAIDTRRVKTKVLVADGGTVVLGGIFEEDDNLLNQKTPFLGDIPGLGALFKSKTDSKRRAELLIFLTPVVLADQ
ncbi:MAG TPA: type IV pilus secretin PilQ [Limnobacter sp.]|nr:type IV pilus secretin PilQ [Limnobacter sp.]